MAHGVEVLFPVISYPSITQLLLVREKYLSFTFRENTFLQALRHKIFIWELRVELVAIGRHQLQVNKNCIKDNLYLIIYIIYFSDHNEK